MWNGIPAAHPLPFYLSPPEDSALSCTSAWLIAGVWQTCCRELHPIPLRGAGGGDEADEEKLAVLPKWLRFGSGIFDICLADKTHHQIWGREGQCPCYQIGMGWHLVWWLPALGGDWETPRTRTHCWGGSGIKTFWWGCGEISAFCVLAWNPWYIKSWTQMKSEWKMSRICLLNKKKRLSDLFFNCPDIWLASGEAPGIKSERPAFLVHFLSVAGPA